MSVRNELRQYLDSTGTPQSAVSRALGISPGYISQYLSDTFRGDKAKMDASVKQLLERWQERKQAPRLKVKFIMTSVARKVFETARICHLDGEMGVVYGDAGLGKTEAVKEYARRNSDTILIEADAGYTAKDLFSELHQRSGIGDGRGRLHDLFTDIVKRMENSGRLIIIDEAENLPLRALELIRRVHDKAGVGILFCGMRRLISNLRGKKGEFAQIYSRIGIAANLQPLTSVDTEQIVSSLLPGSNGIHRTFHEASNSNTRVLSKLIRRSQRVAEINNCAITPDIVLESSKSLII